MISSHASFRTLVLLVTSLTCCAELARAETMDELYEKAKQEKALEFYAAGPSGAEDRWVNEFQQRFPGVHVEVTGGLSPGLSKKVDEQIAQRKMEVDIARFQTIQDFARWKQEGAMLLFKPDGFDKIDPAFKDEDGAFTPVSINTIGYAYNTELVGAGDVAKSALDFLKPIFKNKLLILLSHEIQIREGCQFGRLMIRAIGARRQSWMIFR